MSLQQRGILCRMLRVNYAFHSPQMEPFKTELVEALRGLEPEPAVIPIISTVTGATRNLARLRCSVLGPQHPSTGAVRSGDRSADR